MDGKVGRSGRKWDELCAYLCLSRGGVVRLSLTPRVIRDVCIVGEYVVIGCSRSVLVYRVREVGVVMEVSGLWKRLELRGELIRLVAYNDVLYVYVNRGSKNVLLKYGDELVMVNEVSSVNGACCVVEWRGELCVVCCGMEMVVKKESECVYRMRLRSECVCCVGERGVVWLGCRNGEVLCVRDDGRMNRVCMMRGGVRRLSVSDGGVVVSGVREELLCMFELSEGEWRKKRMRGLSGVVVNECVLLSEGDRVCSYGMDGNGGVLFEESGIESMSVRGELLLGKSENEVLLKRVGGELKQVLF